MAVRTLPLERPPALCLLLFRAAVLKKKWWYCTASTTARKLFPPNWMKIQSRNLHVVSHSQACFIPPQNTFIKIHFGALVGPALIWSDDACDLGIWRISSSVITCLCTENIFGSPSPGDHPLSETKRVLIGERAFLVLVPWLCTCQECILVSCSNIFLRC